METESLIHPVLLCGGSGTRLWPVSRKSYPKQFVELIGKKSLFQLTAERVYEAGGAQPMITTSNDCRFIVLRQLEEVEVLPAQILIEPSPKNTAAAICAAALALEEHGPDTLMLAMPCDHVIPDVAHFRAVVSAGVQAALAGQIVTFGIRPSRAETGYGWLELSQKPDKGFSPTPQALRTFVEKPDQATASALLEGGMHLWNAGIFLCTVETILSAFTQFQPDIIRHTKQSCIHSIADLAFTRLEPGEWDKLPAISIDYAIMEKADNMSVVPYGGDWTDLGDWQAVWRQQARSDTDTVLTGPATGIDCEGSLLHATEDNQPMVGIGLKDIVAVSMPDAVLVAHKSYAQEMKEAVARLKEKDAPQAENLPRDYRPWGWYQSIAAGDRFQVKHILVYPGAALSLQRHMHRAEHWVVVAGTAKVTINDSVTLLTENESAYIPLGATHRLENPGKVPLILIEVQTGTYLGEDDIIRFEDHYARALPLEELEEKAS